MDPAIAERHDEDIRRMERQRQERAEAVGRARAAAAKRDEERRRRARRRGKRAMGWQRRQALGRMRRAKGMAASGQYGIGAEMALRRRRAINTDSDSDEEETVVGGSLRATLGVGHAEGAGGSNLTHNSDTEESMMTDGTTAESEGRKRRRVVMASDSDGEEAEAEVETRRRRTAVAMGRLGGGGKEGWVT